MPPRADVKLRTEVPYGKVLDDTAHLIGRPDENSALRSYGLTNPLTPALPSTADPSTIILLFLSFLAFGFGRLAFSSFGLSRLISASATLASSPAAPTFTAASLRLILLPLQPTLLYEVRRRLYIKASLGLEGSWRGGGEMSA